MAFLSPIIASPLFRECLYSSASDALNTCNLQLRFFFSLITLLLIHMIVLKTKEIILFNESNFQYLRFKSKLVKLLSKVTIWICRLLLSLYVLL